MGLVEIMAWPSRGFIDVDHFMVQVGQLRSMAADSYGQEVVTSISTIVCIVYNEVDSASNTTPMATQRGNYSVVIPSSVTVSEGDHLTEVRDPAGGLVLANARLHIANALDHWLYGTRVQFLSLEILTNPA